MTGFQSRKQAESPDLGHSYHSAAGSQWDDKHYHLVEEGGGQTLLLGDFPGGPAVKNMLSNAGSAG